MIPRYARVVYVPVEEPDGLRASRPPGLESESRAFMAESHAIQDEVSFRGGAGSRESACKERDTRRPLYADIWLQRK